MIKTSAYPNVSWNASFTFFLAFLAIALLRSPAHAADFNREPDAIINTSRLFDLPKDIVAAPILKDLLTEDFVFYYRDGGADWLSFRGTLARIAFEHQVDWPTRLMGWILNGPAEIALWKGDDGKLSNFMLVIDQTGVKDLAQLVAQTALQDAQLNSDATNGRKVHSLTLPTGRTVYLASEESRLFIFTDRDMKIPDQATARTMVERAKAFFGANEDVSIYGQKLGRAKHLITVSAPYFSFGYQAFFSALKAVRFEFSAEAWATRVLTTAGTKTADAGNWSQMPKGAAFCLTIPVDTKKIGTVIKADKWLQKSAGSAIACWYPESKPYTPVLAMRGDFAELVKNPADLKAIFAATIGVREAVWLPKEAEDQPPKLKYLPMLPVLPAKTIAGQVGFTREVGGRYGLYPSGKSASAKLLGSHRFFRVKVVATPNVIVFSPDDQLVDKALTTIGGTFPSMATSLPPSGQSAALVIAPEALAKLTKSAILESLPASQESIFRTAVSRHLFPNLEKFGKRPLQAASLADGADWKVVNWTTNAVR